MSGVYGPLVTLDRVEDALEAVIRQWIDTYLGHVERDCNLALRSIRRPDDASYQIESNVRAQPPGSFPIVQISTPGEVTNPDIDADGVLSGEVVFVVRAFVHAGQGRRSTQRLTHRWAAALVGVIEQKAGDLGGLGEVIRPVLQVPADVPPAPGQDRWLGVAQVGFTVLMSALRQVSGGPPVPDPAPNPLPSVSPTDPTHTSTNVTVTPRS